VHPAAEQRNDRELPLADERELAAIASSTCRVVVEHHQDAAIFRLQGKFDATTCSDVRHLLDVAIGEHSVVLDLTEVSRIDSAGVGALRDLMRCIHEQGRRVALARPWRAAASVLELVGSVGFVFAALSSAGALKWLGDPENPPMSMERTPCLSTRASRD
jgi:anti-anti-sigma factor